ncbi:MAG: YfhO family protein [Bryobacteraceae bacterium]
MNGTEELFGSDYYQVHLRHIAFARDALFGARHTLPGWYHREFAGAPFAANLQSFPWIPTRFPLFLFDPEIAYTAGVAIAAGLAALFAFLYLRRAGLSRLAAVAAAWTFACAGYFSSRVTAGHLPLLEAYPALPLLLWLADRALAPERSKRHAFDLAALALASACIAVAGHPQVPAYSFAATWLYAAWRARGWLRARVMAAIALGIGSAGVALWPMLLLIGRSTRILHLTPANNDITMPWRRLLALISPGIDGWGYPIPLSSENPFRGYPNGSYFWDTVCYLGILPLIAIAALFIVCLIGKRWPDRQWTFLAVLGSGAFLFALPPAQPLFRLVPGTILRSPCRLFYLWTFCAAAALGAAVDVLRRARPPGGRTMMYALLTVCLGLHLFDLGRFDRLFIVTDTRDSDPPDFGGTLDREVGNGRIAADINLGTYKIRYDDVGGFDSIWLARFDRGIKALEGSSPDLNEQVLDGTKLSVATLEAFCVRFVITDRTRPDLEWVGNSDDGNLYRVPNPAPRAAFFEAGRTDFGPEEKIPWLFASHPDRLYLPDEARRYLPRNPDTGSSSVSVEGSGIAYARPSSDEIRLQVETSESGFVHVVETWDPGWTATVDGAVAPVLPANGFAMAVPVAPGSHRVALHYNTPGKVTGAVLSLLSLCLLMVLIWAVIRVGSAKA